MVLEVGPGLGSLTLGLVGAAGKVIAIEVDPVLAAQLPATVAERAGDLAYRLTVIEADAVSIGAVPGPSPTVLVANLPYNVAVPVLLNLLEVLPSIGRALVMVQAEVADRLCAPPGSRTYGIPSVKLAWYGTARRVGAVSRTVFWPVPNVDSALVSFTRHPAGGCGSAVEQAGGVRGRRRGLRPAAQDAAGGAGRRGRGRPSNAERVLKAAGIDPALRGEALGVAQYIRIAQATGSARSIIESWRT